MQQQLNNLVINHQWFNALDVSDKPITINSLKGKRIKILKAYKCEPDGWMDGMTATIEEVIYRNSFDTFVVVIILDQERISSPGAFPNDAINQVLFDLSEGDEFIVL